MNRPLSIQQRARHGVALIIVLAMIVLVSGVVVAFFSRNSVNVQVAATNLDQLATDTLAVSAGDIVIGDLRAEIFKSGTVPLGDTKVAYVSSSNKNWAPTRVGNIPNLVRTSGMWPGSPAVVTGTSGTTMVSTGSPSLNGRYISRERWNAHYLLPLKGDSSAEPVDDFDAPKWIYVDAVNGPDPQATEPTNSIIGRYAYAVYDVGGLLDINVVGAPTSSSAAAVGGKRTIAYADLAQVSSSLNTIRDELVGWRNTSSGSNYDQYVIENTNGFLGPIQDGDKAFYSRQTLIAYWKSKGLPLADLEYFTTYSRALDQPSLSGTYGLTGTSLNLATNPGFAYLSGGTSGSLVEKRFPLWRLAWLTHEGPSNEGPSNEGPSNEGPSKDSTLYLRNALKAYGITDEQLDMGTPINIRTYFGLQWDNVNKRWEYTGTLPIPAVSATSANFFQLLKAAIPNGLLKKKTAYGDYHEWQESLDNDVDRAILQIGANIIDQYDIDSYPTRIFYGEEVYEEVQGIENIPYMSGVRVGLLKIQKPATPTAGQPNTWGRGALLLMPEVWNVNQTFAPDNDFRPTDFRFVAKTWLMTGSTSVPSKIEIYAHSDTDSISEIHELTEANSALLFSDTTGRTYEVPTLLSQSSSGAGVKFDLGTSRLGTMPAVTDKGVPVVDSDDHYLGVLIGDFPLDWVEDRGGGNVVSGTTEMVSVTGADSLCFLLELQYLRDGNWVPYSVRYGPVHEEWRIDPDPALDTVRVFGSNVTWAGTIDPRTGRFGFYVNTGSAAPVATNHQITPFGPGDEFIFQTTGTKWFTGSDLRPGELMKNDSTSATRYADGDDEDAIRPAMLAHGLTSVSGTNRPVILNRPFRSVAELGYVFSDLPWRNLDMSHPKSGFSRLLDVFTLNENENPNGLVAGKVYLNTRQVPVLAALIKGAFKEPEGTGLSDAESFAMAERLVAKTSGSYNSSTGLVPIDPAREELGYISDLVGRNDVGYMGNVSSETVPWLREAPLRALVNGGQTRVWNLMIDVIAQTGRFPRSVVAEGGNNNLGKFRVDGERRYWIYVSIDRLTGEVLDKQFELVTE